MRRGKSSQDARPLCAPGKQGGILGRIKDSADASRTGFPREDGEAIETRGKKKVVKKRARSRNGGDGWDVAPPRVVVFQGRPTLVAAPLAQLFQSQCGHCFNTREIKIRKVK